MSRHLLTILLLCLASPVQAQVAPDVREVARQIASTTNDNAITLAGRQDALANLRESVRLFLSVGETLEAARVLTRVGRLQLILDSPEDAITSHAQALALLKETTSVEVEVDNLNGMAAAYILVDDTRVEEHLNRSLMLSEQSGYTRGKAQALLTLSDYQNPDNHPLALRTAQEALALWQSLSDNVGIARSYDQIGTCYEAQNILPEATQSYEQALQLWRAMGNAPAEAGSLISLGRVDYRKAEWESGIERYRQALNLIDQAAEPDKMGQIAAGLGEIFNDHNRPEDALIQFQQALVYFRQTKDLGLIWFGLWSLGYTYYLQEKYPEALAHLEESLAGVSSNGVRAAASQEHIGKVRMALGDYPAARQAFEFALDIYLRAGNPKEAARTQSLIGQVLEHQGDLASARQNYLKALRTFESFADPINQAAIYYVLGRLELKRKKYDQAEEYLSRSLKTTESMHRISSRDLNMAFSASVHDRYQTYIECLMSKHQAAPNLGLDTRAFEVSESARARSLAEFLRTTQSNFAPGLDPQLAQQEKLLRQSLLQRAEYRTKLLSKKDRINHIEELKALDAELSRLEGEYDQLIATINARYPAYEQITRPVDWNLKRIQEEVIANDQTVLLEYSLGPTKSYVWAVTRNGIKAFELPGRAEIEETANKVYNLLVLPPLADNEARLDDAARELAQMILSPVAAELNKQTILVVADEVLNYIPFQIFKTPSAPNEPLVARYNIVNAPSASVLGDLRHEIAQRLPPPRLLVAFGDPLFRSSHSVQKSAEGDQLAMQTPDGGRWRSVMRDIEVSEDSLNPAVIPPLFYAARELTNLREVTDGNALVVSDEAATRERFLSTDLTRYAILHLATHGYLNPKRPETSGFVLSTTNSQGQEIDGFVGLEEVYGLRAPVLLVVLSACQTALGKDVRGEGLVGLTRGFMYAGASSVVASLWKVDDAATAELMKFFYRNMLQHGMEPAEALRAAQNSIRRQKKWRSPYYWAAFTLQGEYRQAIKPVPDSRGVPLRLKISIVLGLLMLLAVIAWIFQSSRSTAKK